MLEEKLLDIILGFLEVNWQGLTKETLKDNEYANKEKIEESIYEFNTNPENTLYQFQKEKGGNITPNLLNKFIALLLSTVSDDKKAKQIKEPFTIVHNQDHSKYFCLMIASFVLAKNDIVNLPDLYPPYLDKIINELTKADVFFKDLINTNLSNLGYIVEAFQNKPDILQSFIASYTTAELAALLQTFFNHHKDKTSALDTIVKLANCTDTHIHLEFLRKLAKDKPTDFTSIRDEAFLLAIKASNLKTLKFFIDKSEAHPQVYFEKLISNAIDHYQLAILNNLIKNHPILYKDNYNKTYEAKLEAKPTELEEFINKPNLNSTIKDKTQKVIEYIKALQAEDKVSKAELYLVSHATISYLKGEITPEQYQKVAEETEGHASLGMKLLGIAMIALGALALAAGTVITFTSAATLFGVAATPVGISSICAGTAAIAAGIGLFALKGCERGLAKEMKELHNTNDALM